MIEIHVLDAAGEVLVNDQTVFNVRHAADVKVSVEVHLHEVAVNAISNSDAIDRHDDVTTFPRNHDIVKGVVVEERPQGHRRFQLAAEIDVQQQSVFNQLECKVIALRTLAVQNDPVFFVGLEPETEDVSERGHWMSGEVTSDERSSIEVQHVWDVVASVDLNSQRNSVLPSSWIYPQPLSNDRLVKVVSDYIIAIDISAK